MRAIAVWIGALLPSVTLGAQAPDRQLSFEQRVAARDAIERVYDRHRIWPAGSQGAKPPFEERVPKAAIEERVRDDLRRGVALQRYWHRTITSDQLQAELDRILRNSRDLAMLQELAAALQDDPALIAECLVRPILTERLLDDWYAHDPTFHREAWDHAERALQARDTAAFETVPEGELVHARYVLDTSLGARARETAPGSEQRVSKEELARIRADLGPADGATRLHDREEVLQVVFVIRDSGDEIEALVRSFPKEPQPRWWARVHESLPATVPATCPAVAWPLSGPVAGCDHWQATSAMGMPPDPRTGQTAIWTGAELIVWGGEPTYTFVPYNTGGRYSPATDTWLATSTGPNCPSPRTMHTAVWTGSEMIVWGGIGTQGENTGGRYDPVSDTWTPTSTGGACPTPRAGHRAVWTGTEMIVWGIDNTGGRYDPSTDSWNATSTSGACPSPRSGFTMVWTGTKVVVWGGEGGGRLNTGGQYDPATDTWTATSTGAGCPTARAYHTAVWTGSQMIVWGGLDQPVGPCKTGGRYDPSLDAWTATSINGAPSGRYEHSAVWTGSEMIIWGGDNWSAVFNTGGRYAPATDSWVPTSTSATCPSPRYSHSAVFAGTEMIVWGGRGAPAGDLQTGGRYELATDTWVPTSIGGACASPRFQHTAVWTGSEMIVWGGYGPPTTYLQTGGRYSSATDSWSPVSTGAGCPTARSEHTAVWTGSEMIVWGGGYQGAQLNTGGRYSPATDSWQPTSTGSGCPTPRWSHTAVWTGSEMIVWGGPYGWPSNTGGRYAPATDSWIPTSTSGAPPARSYHVAVWTGSEMIVWGGNQGSDEEGGRYDPGTDTWSLMATGGSCPETRESATAVWTGTEMVVWGGYISTIGFTDTGGRYRTATDTWWPTSTAGACPSAREYHTGVWSGDEMVVWGGDDGTPETGGRYDPALDAWVATSTAGAAPSGRHYHTAVWTGNDMIVWGGYPATVSGAHYAFTHVSIDPKTLPDGAIGTSYNQSLAASGGAPPYAFAVTGGMLPPGLALSAGGQLAGTPTSSGIFDFMTTATDANGCTGQREYLLVIPGAACGSTTITLAPPTLPDGWVGRPYDQVISASGGTWPYSYAVVAGSLPPGLNLANGDLSGYASVDGAFSFTVAATDANGCIGVHAYTLAIHPQTCTGLVITLSPPTLPDGTVGVAYSQTITAYGGMPPYSFATFLIEWNGTKPGWSPPPGLSLSSGGVLSGTPTTAGLYDFFVSATDAYGCTGSIEYVMTIQGASCSGVTITLSPATLPNGFVGNPYAQILTASGGSGPYAFAITAGSLPAGLSLSGTGGITGTPTSAGSDSFVVTAMDANGCTGSHPYTITIACAAISMSPPSLPGGAVGVPYSQTFTASGGTAPYAFGVTAGTLPSGLSLSAAGLLSGTPAGKGSYSFTIAATDALSCAGSRAYTLVINRRVDYVVGEGLGQPNPNEVKLYTGAAAFANVDFLAYATGQWGVNVAAADVELAEFQGMLTGPGPGPIFGPQVRAFRYNGTPINKVNFYAYGTLRYGVNVASGNTDADPYTEMITGAGPGAVFGPHVRGFNYDNSTLSAVPKISFYAYGTLKYGVSVSTGDVDGDAYDELLAGAGPGAVFASTVRGFNVDGGSVTSIAKINFNAFSYTGYGVDVAGGDVDADGHDEIVATPGPGPSHPTRFVAFDDATALPGFDITPFSTLYGGRVGAGDVSNDGREDLLCGAGRDSTAPAVVRAYDYTGTALVAIVGTPFGTFTGQFYGVNVAASETGY